MSKNGVIVLGPENILPTSIKKASLIFDKLYLSDAPSRLLFNDFIKKKEIEYLVKQNILIPFNDNEIRKKTIPNERTGNLVSLFSDKLSKTDEYNIPEIIDIATRIQAEILTLYFNEDFFPILYSSEGFINGDKKVDVFKFVLENIPEPEENTSWEQIIDFRNDEETRLKYLALINWINEISKSSYSVGEIKDKYEYLYLDYKKNYERHRMKSKMGIMEILTAAGIALLSSNIPTALTAASHLFKFGKSTLELFTEEGKIPGKEIAYIYKTKQEFDTIQ
jgi:hypothetical protein